MPSQDEIKRTLIFIIKSNNAHGYCNYNFSVADMDEFTKNSSAKGELVRMLRRLANTIEANYPDAG